MSESATAGIPRTARRVLRLLLGTGALAAFWWVLMTGTASAATSPHEHASAGPVHQLAQAVEHAAHTAPTRAPSARDHAVPVRRHHRPAARTVVHAVSDTVAPTLELAERHTVRHALRHAAVAVVTTAHHLVKTGAGATHSLDPVTGALGAHAVPLGPTTTTAIGTTDPAGGAQVDRDVSLTPVTSAARGSGEHRGLLVLGVTPVGSGTSPTPEPGTPQAPSPTGSTPDVGSGASAGPAIASDAAQVPQPGPAGRHPQTPPHRPLERAYPPGSSPD